VYACTAMQLSNASAYRPLSAFKTWEITDVINTSSAASSFPVAKGTLFVQNELVFMVFGLVLGLDLVVAAAYRPLVSKIPVISPPAARSTAEVGLRKAAVFKRFLSDRYFHNLPARSSPNLRGW